MTTRYENQLWDEYQEWQAQEYRRQQESQPYIKAGDVAVGVLFVYQGVAYKRVTLDFENSNDYVYGICGNRVGRFHKNQSVQTYGGTSGI